MESTSQCDLGRLVLVVRFLLVVFWFGFLLIFVFDGLIKGEATYFVAPLWRTYAYSWVTAGFSVAGAQ